LVDWCGAASVDAPNNLSHLGIMSLFVQYCDCLIAAFGRRRALAELRRRYRTKDWATLIWRTRRSWLFPPGT
jgi:hypothetical protein